MGAASHSQPLPAPADLIHRSRKGDREAFRLLIERYQRLVGMIVFRIVPRREEGLDICQDVFLKVWEHLDDFRADAEFSTWIGRIARNTALNFLKRKRIPAFSELGPAEHSIDRAACASPDPEAVCEAEAQRSRLDREVTALPEQDRTMLVLFHQEGMNYEEIGRVMDLPVSFIKSHLFRTRKRLRQRLGGDAEAREVS